MGSRQFPPQHQKVHPGREYKMEPQPQDEMKSYRGSGKLKNKVAIITGGDSGIGRATAIAFAKEGAKVVIVYLDEHKDAEQTRRIVAAEKQPCITIPGDLSQEKFCENVIEKTIREFGKLDILVNNAGVQYVQEKLEDISAQQLERTFQVNVFSQFYLTKAALPYLKEGSAIINTSSVTAYKGMPILLDYSATKGAISAFTYSLSQSLAERGIRVNAVAPGPVWTPLIPSSFSAEHVKEFGDDTPMGRAGQPDEIAPAYVFLASADSSYITGQVLHINGGKIVHA